MTCLPPETPYKQAPKPIPEWIQMEMDARRHNQRLARAVAWLQLCAIAAVVIMAATAILASVSQ